MLYWVSAGVLGWSAMLVVASTSVVEPWRVLAWTVDASFLSTGRWGGPKKMMIPFFIGRESEQSI